MNEPEASELRLQSADGGEFSAYCAFPEHASAPALVVLTPVFGVDRDMRGFVDRYAQRGFIAIAPDLFWRESPGVLARTDDGRTQAQARARRVDAGVCAGDVRTTIEALRVMPACNGNVAALGICFGGRYAYLAAARGDVAAAGAYHGTQIGECLAGAPPVTVPISLHFGGADPLTPEGEISAIAAALRDNPDAEICVYPGAEHNFSIPGHPSCDAEAARRAEASVFALFDRLK